MWLTKTKYNQLLPTIPHTAYAQNELGYHTAVTCPWMLWFWWTNLSCSKATRPCGPSIKSPQSALLASKISSEFRSVAALRLSTSWAWRSCWTGRRWLHGDVWLTVHVICKGNHRAHGPLWPHGSRHSKLAIGELSQWLVGSGGSDLIVVN
jgi:hypothetical protein